MTESLKITKQTEEIVDVGVTALLHWTEDRNIAATAETRSGRLVAESEHEEARLEVEAAAALYLNGDALAGSTESEHADLYSASAVQTVLNNHIQQTI